MHKYNATIQTEGGSFDVEFELHNDAEVDEIEDAALDEAIRLVERAKVAGWGFA